MHVIWNPYDFLFSHKISCAHWSLELWSISQCVSYRKAPSLNKRMYEWDFGAYFYVPIYVLCFLYEKVQLEHYVQYLNWRKSDTQEQHEEANYALNLYFIFRKCLPIQIILAKLSRTHLKSNLKSLIRSKHLCLWELYIFFLILFRIYWDLQNLFADLNFWQLETDGFGEGSCFLLGIH